MTNNSTNIIVIIQARMGSTRLPGKVLLPIGDSCSLELAVERSRRINRVSKVIVATSSLQADDAIALWCERRSIDCFRGSEQDVLSRYYECASPYSPDYVIRVTSDCPFLDDRLASSAVQLMLEKPCDLVVLEGELPRGLAAEVFSFEALSRIYWIGKEERHREHVTYYAYEYAEQFERVVLEVPETLRHPELRLTLDTEEDYALCKAIATRFNNLSTVPVQQVIDYLLQHPEIADINAHINQKPVV